LADPMNAVLDQARADTLALVIERFERRLTEEVGKVNERITQEVPKLQQQIADLKADLIRWMFLFWVGQLGAMLGILLLFSRK